MKKGAPIDLYNVDHSDQFVELTVNVLNGHHSNSMIFLNHQLIAGTEMDGSFRGSFEMPLGTNSELIGKKFQLTTLFPDKSQYEKKIRLTVSLSGGCTPYSESMEIDASGEAEMANYSMDLKFNG